MTAAAHPLPRMVGGADGLDSPQLDGDVPAAWWDRWLQIADDRHAGRRTPLEVLAAATGADLDASSWPRWWDRAERDGELTHRAAVVRAPAGTATLLSRCGYSQPWTVPLLTVWSIGDPGERNAARTYCIRCVGTRVEG